MVVPRPCPRRAVGRGTPAYGHAARLRYDRQPVDRRGASDL